jgi:hypothetical protein
MCWITLIHRGKCALNIKLLQWEPLPKGTHVEKVTKRMRWMIQKLTIRNASSRLPTHIARLTYHKPPRAVSTLASSYSMHPMCDHISVHRWGDLPLEYPCLGSPRMSDAREAGPTARKRRYKYKKPLCRDLAPTGTIETCSGHD